MITCDIVSNNATRKQECVEEFVTHARSVTQWFSDKAAMQEVLHTIVQCRRPQESDPIDEKDDDQLGAASEADSEDTAAPTTPKAHV